MDSHSALVQVLQFNDRALGINLAGISHADSVFQPPSGNCINWVLGHILAHRNIMLEILEQRPVWNPERQLRYARGSEPIREEGYDVEPVDLLVTELDNAMTALHGAVLQFRTSLSADHAAPREAKLLGLCSHETYHIGQIGLLRRLVGHEGALG